MPTTTPKKHEKLTQAFPDIADHLFDAKGELNVFGKLANELLGLRECCSQGLLLTGSGVTDRPVRIINLKVSNETSPEILAEAAAKEFRVDKNKKMGIIITPQLTK